MVGGLPHGNCTDFSTHHSLPISPAASVPGTAGSCPRLDAVSRSPSGRSAAACSLAESGRPASSHQRPVCPLQSDHPDDLPAVPRQCGCHSRATQNQPQDPLPLQGQTILSLVLACTGGQCGARTGGTDGTEGTDRLAYGTREAVTSLQTRPARGAWEC